MKQYDVAVLGGGLLGRLTAWLLADQGCKVVLLNAGKRNGEGAAAFAAAAMLAPTAEAAEATPLVVQLGYASLPIWRQWVNLFPTPVFMQQNGSLIVWHSQDHALVKQFSQHLQRAHVDSSVWQVWHNQEISEHEPQLSGRFQQGLFLPTEGQLDNRQTLLALADMLDRQQVSCYWEHCGDLAECAAFAHWTLDCRGYGGKSNWNSYGQSRLRGVRGEVLRVYAPDIVLHRPVRVLHPRYPIYIAPKQNKLFVVGATQIESEDNSNLSVRSGLELMSALYSVHPAFGEARILESLAELRPTLNHESPEIRYDIQNRVVTVNGLFRHGFMISPAVSIATVHVLQALMQQQLLPDAQACYHIDVLPVNQNGEAV
jgi:glycine oxidase